MSSKATGLRMAKASLPTAWDPIGELRAMAKGESRLLPTLAHAKAAVAHIDQLIANLRETHELLHDARNDLFVSEIRVKAQARELESLKGV